MSEKTAPSLQQLGREHASVGLAFDAEGEILRRIFDEVLEDCASESQRAAVSLARRRILAVSLADVEEEMGRLTARAEVLRTEGALSGERRSE